MFQLFSFIIIALIISFIIRNLVYYCYVIGINNKNNSYNYDIINDITRLLSNCSITNFKEKDIKSKKDFVRYINHLSCVCKGIGYWGGFCLSKDKIYVGGNQYHDEGLTKELALLFQGKSVVDLGSGLGWYCPIISKTAAKCDQYDGSVNIEEVTNGKVKYLNLAEPITFNCNYDIVISLEVAEHIPIEYEGIYINNLVKCSKNSILVTWSRIGQPGHFHVNNKRREEVINIFNKKGLIFDDLTTNKLKNATNIWWLKNNILYFKKCSNCI